MKTSIALLVFLALITLAGSAFAESRLFDHQGTRFIDTVDNDRSANGAGYWTKAPGAVNDDQLESDGKHADRRWLVRGLNINSRYRVSVSWRPVLNRPQNPKTVSYFISAFGPWAGRKVLMSALVDQSRQCSNFMTREQGRGYLYTAAWETIGEISARDTHSKYYSKPYMDLEIALNVPEGSVGVADAVRVEEITDDFRVVDNSAKVPVAAGSGPVDHFFPASSKEYFMYTANGPSMHHQPAAAKAGDWYFMELPQGLYQIAATWPYSTTASQSVTYAVSINGASEVKSAPFNQRYTPVDFSRRGATWNYLRDLKGKPLTVYVPAGSRLKISLSGTDKNVLADAVALVSPGNQVFDDFESYTMSDLQYDNLWNFVNFGGGAAASAPQTYFRSGTLAALSNSFNLKSKKNFKEDLEVALDFSIGPVNYATVIYLNGRQYLSGREDQSDTFLSAYLTCGYIASRCDLRILEVSPRSFNVLASKTLNYSDLNSISSDNSDRLVLSMKGENITVKLNDKHVLSAVDKNSLLNFPIPLYSVGMGVSGAWSTVVKQLYVKE